MIILINTGTPVCYLSFVEGSKTIEYSWESGRELAKGLLGFLNEKLLENNLSWTDISGIGVFAGPGSFTGLRIGITIFNTIADSMNIPIVSGSGEDWKNEVLIKLQQKNNEKIVLPYYGSEAKITQPRK